jgi:hypothetical protein
MDVFYVNLVTDAGGWSTVDGSCDKNSRGRTGAVIEVKPSTFFSGNEANRNLWAGILLAHEVAHYLGLPGGNDPTNLMGDTAVGGVDQIFLTSINISTDQGDIMRDHCFIQPPC